MIVMLVCCEASLHLLLNCIIHWLGKVCHQSVCFFLQDSSAIKLVRIVNAIEERNHCLYIFNYSLVLTF